MATKQHKLSDDKSHCVQCGLHDDDEEFSEPCEPEDLSMWCAPGQSVMEMLEQAADRDRD
jgi:hypothetical protein